MAAVLWVMPLTSMMVIGFTTISDLQAALQAAVKTGLQNVEKKRKLLPGWQTSCLGTVPCTQVSAEFFSVMLP